jgi:hypothetical protein
VPLESLTPRLNFYGRKTDFETVILIHFFIRQTLEVLVEGAHSRLCQCTLSTDRHAKSILYLAHSLTDGQTTLPNHWHAVDGQTILPNHWRSKTDRQLLCPTLARSKTDRQSAKNDGGDGDRRPLQTTPNSS